MAERVAIVGAGPAGAFAADRLLRARGGVEIDLFERLPTPWGLLRAGVAPDHQEIKRLDETFDEQTLRRGCRFFGNVEVGVDLTHEDLMNHYSAVSKSGAPGLGCMQSTGQTSTQESSLIQLPAMT